MLQANWYIMPYNGTSKPFRVSSESSETPPAELLPRRQVTVWSRLLGELKADSGELIFKKCR